MIPCGNVNINMCFHFVNCYYNNPNSTKQLGLFRVPPGPLYQNEVKCSVFDMEMSFHSHANKTHFHLKGCALGLNLQVRVFGTRKWPIKVHTKRI